MLRSRVGTCVAVACLAGVVSAPAQAAEPPSRISPIAITKVQYSPPGSDTVDKLNGEYFVVKNTTSRARALTGYTVRDESRRTPYRFPRFTLGAGSSVTVHTGSGQAKPGHLYWGESFYVWNNTGDTVSLRNPGGTVVDTCSYAGPNVGVKLC